jgi:NADH:ubiquinone oxidoreductase subunit E
MDFLSHIEKSMGDLTKTQRKGIRTILHLCKETETSMYSLSHQIHNDNISTTKVKYCMSVLCALYHVSLNMKEQEQRYTEINKLPLEVHDSVLDALGIDLSFKACASYKPAT